ncbi:MAG: exported protein of unknown function [Bryobacterales bacterium]|nr:exported protein of unknown function [Bryobacterales bacterium]
MGWMSWGRSRAGRGCLAVAMVLAAGGNQSLFAGTVDWTVGNGNWTDDTNWNPQGVPGSDSDVTINLGLATLSGAATIQSLLVGDGGALNIDSGGNLTIGPGLAPAVLQSSGVITVADQGLLSVVGEGTLSGNSTFIGNAAGDAAQLQVSGNLQLNGADLVLQSGSGIHGEGSLALDFSSRLLGAGTITVATVTNAGSIEAYDEALVLSGATTLTNWNGATATLTGGAYSAYAGVLQLGSIGEGSIETLDQAGVLEYGGGLVTGDGLSSAVRNLTNIKNGDYALAFSGTEVTITPNSGDVATGTLQVTANGGLEAGLSVFAASLNVAGNLGNSALDGGYSAVDVLGGATLTVAGNFTQTNSYGSLAETFVGGSALHVAGDTSQHGTVMTFTDFGKIPAQGLQAIEVSKGNGTTGTFDGAFNNKDLDGWGSLLDIGGSTVTTSAFQNDYASEVDLHGGSQLTTGAFTNNGVVSLCGCSANELTVADGDFTNDQGIVTIGAGNTLTVSNGLYLQVAPQTVATFAAVAPDESATEVNGTLRANVVLNGGILTGLGTIDGNLENNATVAPIDSESDLGTLTVSGNYLQGMLGLLQLDLGGLDFGNLVVGGNVTLDGLLDVRLREGYTPTANDSFRILAWGGTLSGMFADWTMPTVDGLAFSLLVGSNDIFLQVTDASTATPEPSTVLLTFAGLFPALLLVAAMRRRAQLAQVPARATAARSR